MSSQPGPSAPPIQATGPDPLPLYSGSAIVGISAPGSIVGTPPAIDATVGATLANQKRAWGSGR